MKAPDRPHILFVFLDGVGLGASDPETNPLAASWSAFEQLAVGQQWTKDWQTRIEPERVVRSIDANLGMEGLPQSGTGQATLFTGVNCAEVAGRHFGPFPHSKTKSVIARENVFTKVNQLGPDYKSAFANAYPDRFFEMVEKRNRWTVTTLCCAEAGVTLRGYQELQTGQALAADITGAGWRTIGYDFDSISEAEAGRRLVRLAQQHHFTLFEYYLTDKVGHRRQRDVAGRILAVLNRFFEAIIKHMDTDTDLLLITSDHGNLEDLSVKTHTRNPVPFIAYGHRAEVFAGVRSLIDITPTVIEALKS